MTEHYNGQPQDSRLDRIENILLRLAENQVNTQHQLTALTERQENTQYVLDDFLSTSHSVLARNEIVNDTVLELRETREQDRRDFLQHQQSIEAGFSRLEAILIRLIEKID